ncbi:hypothetical protein JL720_1359 [Aureococcus anophagefferens]|nr:hypothetical protein JL720_1359 [Aureococcus anophagefferens]
MLRNQDRPELLLFVGAEAYADGAAPRPGAERLVAEAAAAGTPSVWLVEDGGGAESTPRDALARGAPAAPCPLALQLAREGVQIAPDAFGGSDGFGRGRQMPARCRAASSSPRTASCVAGRSAGMRVVGLSYDDDLADAADVVVGELEDDWDCVTFDGLHTPATTGSTRPRPQPRRPPHEPEHGRGRRARRLPRRRRRALDDGDGLTDDERRILAELKVELAAFDEEPASYDAMPLTRAQRNAAADQDASADAPAASSSQAPARRAFGAVDNQRKGKRKAAAKKEPAREVHDRAVTDYAVDLYKYYRDAEEKRPMELYMEFQQDINPKMRGILVDWLVEVHLKFKMLQPTIYLTVQIIDRYLSAKQIDRNQLQLLGVAALFIASKYEEIYPPEDVLDMEMTILRELDWNISSPSAHHWLVRLARVARAPKSASDRAEYFAQRMLQECDARVQAVAPRGGAHLAFVADEGCDDGWPRACERLTGYTDVELYPCCKAISYHINRGEDGGGSSSRARKFSRHDFSTVSFGKCPVLKRPKLIDLPDLAD